MDHLYEFLKNEHLHKDCYDILAETDKLRADMQHGLYGCPSSLFMLPSFICPEFLISGNETVIVIDAGGTNLRVGAVTFEGGKISKIEFEKHPLPGLKEELSCTEFFDSVAQKLSPYLDKGTKIGFCFSYAAECLENKDAKIIDFCKEVKIRDAQGAMLCQELQNAIARTGNSRRYSFVQLNDTVATLLGGMAECDKDHYSGFIGFILGTGTNACYIEQTKNIKKYSGNLYRGDSMIINMESGCYSGFPKGELDRYLDKQSQLPFDHQTEKLIGGVYMSKILAAALKKAEKTGLIYNAPQLNEIPLPDANAFLQGEDSILDCIGSRENAREIILALYGRTARIMAIICAAVALHTAKGQKKPIAIVIEGSTYHKSPALKRLFEIELDNITKLYNCRFEITSAANATLTGSAFAALNNA